MFEALLLTSIAAVVELLKRIRIKDYEGIATIIVAGLVGGLATLLPEFTFTVSEGIIAGLGIAGVHQIARQIG